MTAAMAAERTRERVVLVVDDDPDILQTLALCLSTEATASDGFERTGGPRRPSSAEARMHPARSDDAGDGRLAVRHRDGAARLAQGAALDPQRGSRGAGARHPLHADAYLAKPFDLDELLGKVSALTGGPDGHGQTAKRSA